MGAKALKNRPSVEIRNGEAIIDGRPIALRGLTIDRIIDSGAHGTVFEGTETALERKVAVKVWYKVGDKVREGAIGEVRKLASIVHPLYVTVYQMDVSEAAPYSTMELLTGPSLKAWLRERDFRRLDDVDFFLHLRVFQDNLRQRCKFWFLYSSGLKHLYSQNLLHGDPHLGNVIVVDDELGISNRFVDHHIHSKHRLLSIRILDLGTSLFRADRHSTIKREADIIKESAQKLFPDFPLGRTMNLNLVLEPPTLLRVLDCFVEYVLELSNVPTMTKDDYHSFEHGFPQLLGWCPFFNYQTISDDLVSLFTTHEAKDLMSQAVYQMLGHCGGASAEEEADRLNKSPLEIHQSVARLTELSPGLRSPHWVFQSPNDL